MVCTDKSCHCLTCRKTQRGDGGDGTEGTTQRTGTTKTWWVLTIRKARKTYSDTVVLELQHLRLLPEILRSTLQVLPRLKYCSAALPCSAKYSTWSRSYYILLITIWLDSQCDCTMKHHYNGNINQSEIVFDSFWLSTTEGTQTIVWEPLST